MTTNTTPAEGNDSDQTPSVAGSQAVPCSVSENEEYAHPAEWQAALDALYGQYSNDPTTAQRTKILETALGLNEPGVSYSISSTADWRIPQEEIDLRNMRMLEMDYLEQLGLHRPEYL